MQAYVAHFNVCSTVNLLLPIVGVELDWNVTMLGVVLWSDAADRKAVIWCEDQGDLAFFNCDRDPLDRATFFDAGDLVQFDMEVRQSMRHAHNPRLVIEQAGSRLPQVLREQSPDTVPTKSSARIIPFAPRTALCDDDATPRRVKKG